MDIESYREFCLRLQDCTESLPFDENTLVFKVAGKMFALCDIQDFDSVNLKCDPEMALELREKYPDVTPGYHMNKKHWNTVKVNSSVSDSLIYEWTIQSYRLVIATLPLKIRAGFKNIT